MSRALLCHRGPALAFLFAVVGCDEPRGLTLEVTPGHETDAFSLDPAIERITVAAVDAAGAEITAASTAPGGSFELGELATDQLVRFEVRGTDARGDVHVRGRSLGFVLGALESEVFPIFAQRLDRWSRPPGTLPDSHTGGLAAALGERYLVLTGGTAIDGAATDLLFYDLLSLGGVAGGTLSFVPSSLAVSADGRSLILIGDERAVWLDFDTGQNVSLEPPEGLGSFATVAGGAVIDTPSALFVVGATRATGEPTDRVLIIEPTGRATTARLNTPRLGAAASWVEGVGLLVVGGAAEGAGVEVLEDGSTDADNLPFAADASVGVVATLGAASEQLVLLCGADATGAATAVRLADLDCGADCALVDLAIDLPPLTDCAAYATEDGIIVVGHNASLSMESYVIDLVAETVTPLPLREDRSGGRVVAAPNGTLALIGGAHPDGSPAVTIELLFPDG